MADRLSIDRKINDTVVPAIDDTRLLGLDKNSVSRTELFLFAIALGIKEGRKTPLSAAHGFILEGSINDNDMAILHTLLVEDLRKRNEEEKIGDKDEAFKVAQEYANTGFWRMKKWLDGLTDERAEALLWELLFEMDETFEQIGQSKGQ